MSGRRKGPITKSIDPRVRRTQQIAESVIRPNSPIRRAYDSHGCQPPIGSIKGVPAIEVAGHIIARVEQTGISMPELVSTATVFRDNAIAVRVIGVASR